MCTNIRHKGETSRPSQQKCKAFKQQFVLWALESVDVSLKRRLASQPWSSTVSRHCSFVGVGHCWIYRGNFPQLGTGLIIAWNLLMASRSASSQTWFGTTSHSLDWVKQRAHQQERGSRQDSQLLIEWVPKDTGILHRLRGNIDHSGTRTLLYKTLPSRVQS